MNKTVIPSTGPLSVKCPLCGAEPGQRCVTVGIHTISSITKPTHLLRIRVANGLKRSSS